MYINDFFHLPGGGDLRQIKDGIFSIFKRGLDPGPSLGIFPQNIVFNQINESAFKRRSFKVSTTFRNTFPEVFS